MSFVCNVNMLLSHGRFNENALSFEVFPKYEYKLTAVYMVFLFIFICLFSLASSKAMNRDKEKHNSL